MNKFVKAKAGWHAKEREREERRRKESGIEEREINPSFFLVFFLVFFFLYLFGALTQVSSSNPPNMERASL